jgi:folate-binding protein YgfZ
VTNAKGRILGHVLVFAEKESLWLDSDPGTQSALLAHLNRYVITEDVEFHDRTTDFAKVFVCGPWTSAVLLDAYIRVFEETEMYGRVSPTIDIDPVIRRVSFVAAPACLVIAPREASELLDLRACQVAPATRELFDLLRIEAMWPRYGVDITEDHLAQEAGRTAQAISFTKGCYLGQEPIARLDALGHTNRELRGIRFESPGEMAAGSAVLDAAEAEVGRISSVAVNPATNCPVALAMLKTAANGIGTLVRSRDDHGDEVGGAVFGALIADR